MMIADNIPTTLLIALLGMGIVFAALTVLILLMGLLTKVTAAKRKRAEPSEAAPQPEPAQAVKMVPAKGSLGDVALYDVDDRTAALIMAIVADELKKPLNELRFRSIRECKAEIGEGKV